MWRMGNKKVGLGVLVLGVVLAGGALESQGASIVDQVNNPRTSFFSAGVPGVWGQTFTVGVSGQLTGLDVRMFRLKTQGDTGYFTVQIRDTVAGVPTSFLTTTPRASQVVSDMMLPTQDWSYMGFTHIDLSASNLMVKAGEVWAFDIFLSQGDASNGFVMTGSSDKYSGGAHYSGWVNSNNWTRESEDLIFQTYVDPTVPEPASLGMLGLGLMAVLRHRRA